MYPIRETFARAARASVPRMQRHFPLESWFAAAIRDALPPDDYRAVIELSRAEGLDEEAIERAFHDAVAEVLGSPTLAMHLTAAFAAECIARVVAERYGA